MLSKLLVSRMMVNWRYNLSYLYDTTDTVHVHIEDVVRSATFPHRTFPRQAFPHRAFPYRAEDKF